MHAEKVDALDEKAALGPPAWLELRAAAVDAAVDKQDQGALRRLSAQPGGFGSKESRRRAWQVGG